MTGPEHYREAERLMNKVTDENGDPGYPDGSGASVENTRRIIALADAHAKLAQVSATIHAANVVAGRTLGGVLSEQWLSVLDTGMPEHRSRLA
jgi:hypothetical protein